MPSSCELCRAGLTLDKPEKVNLPPDYMKMNIKFNVREKAAIEQFMKAYLKGWTGFYVASDPTICMHHYLRLLACQILTDGMQRQNVLKQASKRNLYTREPVWGKEYNKYWKAFNAIKATDLESRLAEYTRVYFALVESHAKQTLTTTPTTTKTKTTNSSESNAQPPPSPPSSPNSVIKKKTKKKIKKAQDLQEESSSDLEAIIQKTRKRRRVQVNDSEDEDEEREDHSQHNSNGSNDDDDSSSKESDDNHRREEKRRHSDEKRTNPKKPKTVNQPPPPPPPPLPPSPPPPYQTDDVFDLTPLASIAAKLEEDHPDKNFKEAYESIASATRAAIQNRTKLAQETADYAFRLTMTVDALEAEQKEAEAKHQQSLKQQEELRAQNKRLLVKYKELEEHRKNKVDCTFTAGPHKRVYKLEVSSTSKEISIAAAQRIKAQFD